MRYLLWSMLLFCLPACGQECKVNSSVVWRDQLNNLNQYLGPKDVKWFDSKLAKKYPGVCYRVPNPDVPVVFFIAVSNSTYHGARTVTSTSSNPISGTVDDESGSEVGTISGSEQTTSTTAVPVRFDYPVFTLLVEVLAGSIGLGGSEQCLC